MSLPILRPYQPPVVEYLRHHKRAIIKSPAGSGKTIIAAAALHAVVTGRARPLPPKIGWIANTLEQCQQARAALALFPMEIDIRIACAQGQPDMSDRHCLIVDECFPAGTKIDGKNIEEIRAGDLVRCVDHKAGTIEKRRVIRKFWSRPVAMVRVWLEGGVSIACTSGHPFWDGIRYVRAEELTSNSVVVTITGHETRIGSMQEMRRDGRLSPMGAAPISKATIRDGKFGVLLGEVQGGMGEGGRSVQDGEHKQGSRVGADEGTESNEEGGRTSGRIDQAASDAVEAQDTGREWAGANGGGDADCSSARVGCEPHCEDAEGADLPAPLQNRRGESGSENCDRSRRSESLLIGATATRSEEGSTARFSRVDRVEVLQRGSNGEFGEVCSGGLVYNLEVEEHHNYFANGILVHNCHHAPSPLWRSIIEKCSGAWWGFTATPGEPEQEAVLTNLFGGNLFEITRAQVANNLAAARVVLFDDTDPDLREPIDARIQEELVRFRKFMPKEKVESEMWPKVAYRVCLEMGIKNNLARNARVAELISRHPLETCLVLVNSKEHGHELAEAIPGAVVAHSKMGVRKRREAMAAIVDGSLRCMIATSVLDEGFDCPRATVLVMACGGKAAGRVEQRTGRVLRSFQGKREGIIYDFEDPQHPLLANQARKRQALYHSLGYAVEREADRQPQLL